VASPMCGPDYGLIVIRLSTLVTLGARQAASSFNDLKRAHLMMLNRIADLAGHLDALTRPAIARSSKAFAAANCAIGGTSISTGFLSISTLTTPLIMATSLSMASAPRSRANMRTSCSSLRCSMVFGLIGRPPGLPLWPFANGRPRGRPIMPDMLTTAVPSAERGDRPPYGLSGLLAEVEAALPSGRSWSRHVFRRVQRA
jgi:hypothetical protein